MESQFILEMRSCRKTFPGVIALDDVSIFLKRGEVHALVGENGAGKSTIMKILAGIYQPDSGEILYDGKPFIAKRPADALTKGISMVHQELDLVPDMTVEMNVFAGRELQKGPVADKKEMTRRTQEILSDLGVSINPRARVGDLSTAQQQMISIVKAIAFNADIIIMDEPTSAITDREVKRLFEIISKLKARNKAIVYISHKMDEIFEVSDQVTVLRDGKFIGSVKTCETTGEEIVKMMVGRDLKDMYVKNALRSREFDENEVLLKVEGLGRQNEFANVSFEVKRGEILGIYGLMGAGRTEVVETIFGLRKAHAGTVTRTGYDKKLKSPGRAIQAGIGFVSEDRKIYGLNLIDSVKNNISIAYMKYVLCFKYLINFKKEKEIVDKWIKEINIKTPTRDTPCNSLSGGNQQKVILAKWLLGDPDILIMDEPTRGIDVGAKAEIYKLMDANAKKGKAVIMISSELPELLGMSDRVIVMHEGVVTGEFENENLNQELLMSYAIGERRERQNEKSSC